MSDLDDKLARPEHSQGAAARATLKQLLARWGELELVRVNSMGGEEVWTHVQGKGLDAVFARRGAA